NPSEYKTDRDYLDVEIRAPEFVAEDIQFSYKGIAIPYKPITITATVNNTRDISIDNVEIQFLVDNQTISQSCTYDPFGYIIECRDVTFNIGALSKAKISYIWTPTTGGTHDIAIAVNPAKKIVERDYGNNNLTKKFSLEPQADLAPIAIWFNNSEYIEGERVTVYATIENVGKNKSYWGYAVFCDRQRINCTPASPYYDADKCDGIVSYPCGTGATCWVCEPVGFGNLEAGENVTINYTFTLADGYSSSQGTHYFSVVTGDVGSGDDDNSNNAIYTTYTVKPSQVNLRYDDCNGWCDPFYFTNPEDEILRLYLREGNAGGEDAKNYSIRIYYDNNPANLLNQTNNLTLNNHTLITRTFDVNWSAVPDGDREIYAYIDYNNEVNESNEGDNIVTTPFKWIDLVASSISFSIEHPRAGDLISISATIRNEGDIRTKEFSVDLYIDGQFVERKNTSIPAHSQSNVIYNWTVPKSQMVNHDVMIKVDPEDVIKLESEANNVLKKQLSTIGWEMHLLAKGFKHHNLTSYENSGGAFTEKDYNLKDLFMEFHSAPAFADLDGDGDLDLMVGDITGKLRTYKNTGSALNATWVESYWAYGIDAGSYSTPAFADLDNDSDLDLVVGNNFGSLSVYENTGNATNPAWSKVDKWNITKISVSSYAAPAYTDLDDLVDLDLIIGSGDGKLYSYENTGNYTWQEIDWTADIDAEQNAAPAFADLDGDDDLDLIVGLKNGTIYSYENIGSASSPIWQMATWTSSIKTGSHAKPALADLDGDGDKDLVIGSNNDGFIPLRAGYTEPIYLEVVNYGNFTMTVERVSFELLNKSSGNKITDLFVAPPIIIPALAAIEREFIITPPVDIPENTTLAIVTENVFPMSPAWINNPELGGYTTDVLVDAITTLEISGSYRVLYNDTMSPKFVCSNWCPIYNLTPYKMATIIADSPAGINVYEKERRTNFEIIRPDRAPVTIYIERLGESFSLRPGYIEDIEFTIQNNNKKEYKVDRLTFELYKDGKIYDLYTDTNGFTLPREESIRKSYKFYVPEGVPLNATFILKVGTKYGFPDGSWHRNNINIYPNVAGIGGLGCAFASEDIPLKGRYDVNNLTLFTNESSWGAQYFSSGDIFSLMDILAKFNYIIDPTRVEEEFNRVLSSPIVGEYISYFGVTPDIVNIEDVRNIWNQKIHRYHSEIDDASYLRKHIWIPSTLQKAELYQKVTCACPMGVPNPPSGIITWVNEKNKYSLCADLCNFEQKGWTSLYYDLKKGEDNYITLYSYGPSREFEVNFYDLIALDYVHAATDRALEPAFDINVSSIGYKGLLRRGYEEPVNITIINNDDDPFIVRVVEFDLISDNRKIHLLTTGNSSRIL
ncbi:MAG: CARDB domain-containing protein, partial [Halobacteria archaeon]